MQDNMKRNFLIERLAAAGVSHSQQGQNIYELEYKDLRYELVMQNYRKIDVENQEEAWF